MWASHYTLPFHLQITMTLIAVGTGVPRMKEKEKSYLHCTAEHN